MQSNGVGIRREIVVAAQLIVRSRVSSAMEREPDRTSPANPRTPSGGMSILLLSILVLVVGVLLAWGLLRSHPGAPTPTATGTPPVMPAGSSGH
jgi:hypothetical protein